LIDKAVEGVPFEVVNTEAAKIKLGQALTLTGFGCIQPGGGGGNDGKYRVAEAIVTQLPSGRSNDIVTERGAALCYGDSGGPAFLVNGESRVVVSVNSRGDIRTTSYLSSVTTDEAKAFFKSWMDKNAQKVCGISADAPGCRGQGGEVPPPPPPPGDCKMTYGKVGECLFGKTPSAAAPDACYKEVGKLFACLDKVVSF
jgi:hypothetical protein